MIRGILELGRYFCEFSVVTPFDFYDMGCFLGTFLRKRLHIMGKEIQYMYADVTEILYSDI
jgi:hypothetical protein